MSSVPVTNYVAHAIGDIRAIQSDICHREPATARELDELRKLLQIAQKFLLPEGGLLLDVDQVREGYADLLRLPYPVVALEFPEAKQSGDSAAFPSSKCIVLAWTGEADTTWKLSAKALEGDATAPDQYLYATTVPYDDEQQLWVPSASCFYFNRENMEVVGKGRGLNGLHPIFPYPEWGRRLKQDPQFEAALDNEIGRAFQPLIEFCLTVNCENVAQEVITPSSALNKKRIASGKEPFDSYRLLTIPGSTSNTSDQGGSHASPRMHLRRGHLRRLASGSVTWVRHTMVGTPTLGTVEKTYAVR